MYLCNQTEEQFFHGFIFFILYIYYRLNAERSCIIENTYIANSENNVLC